MSNQITGRVLSISPITQIAGRNGMITKRSIIIDCSRFNQNTGEKYENTPMLEFIGNTCNELDNFRNGDLVTINFDVQGTKYEKDGQTQIFTRVRPFRIEARPTQQIPQPQPFQQPQFQQPQQQLQQSQQQFYGSGQPSNNAPQSNNFFGGGEVPF